jgi:hypothetical protein
LSDSCSTTTTRPNYTCVRVFKHLGNGYRYPTYRSLSELAVDATTAASVRAGTVDDAFWSRVHALAGAMPS